MLIPTFREGQTDSPAELIVEFIEWPPKIAEMPQMTINVNININLSIEQEEGEKRND